MARAGTARSVCLGSRGPTGPLGSAGQRWADVVPVVKAPPAPPLGKKPTKEASIAIEVAGIVVRAESRYEPRVAGGRAGRRRQHDLASGGCAGSGGDPTGRPAQGCDGLAALVRETLRLDPVFVLRAKPADRVDESGRNKTE
jgi:hypothetical protein